VFENIVGKIEEYDKIIIHRHCRPDGDAIGSQVGLKGIIKANWPGKKVLCTGDPAGRYGFIEGSVMDEVGDEDFPGSLCFILDCGAASLVSDERYRNAGFTIRIDHHLPAESFCRLEVLDPGFESCCSMIAVLGLESGLVIDKTAASALYAGMVTDSGRFLYDSTKPRTLRIASELLERGVDTQAIYSSLYNEDLAILKLRAEYFLKVRLTRHNVAYIYTTQKELESYKLDAFAVSRGMVNTMANIKGVDIWVSFTESEGSVLCELRSSRLNINPIAVKYGGGGHAKASGATVARAEIAMSMLEDLDELEAQNE
jgi:phosphoesterase RecJ-like protein